MEQKPAEKKKSKLAELEKQLAEYKEALLRLQAEFQNALKRAEKEKEELATSASKELLLQLLVIIDDFEHALKSITKSDNKEEIMNGVKLICEKLHALLEKQGVKPIQAVGHPFDPFKHEVVKTCVADVKDGTVIEEIQRGYELNGRVLRPSKVVIAKSGGESNG